MEKWVDISGISIPSDENDYYELVAFADAIAELEPIYMESVQAEAYNRGIDSERKRIADAWCKAEYERSYKDGRKSADRPRGEWIEVRAFDALGGDEAAWMAHGNPIAFHYCSECKEQTRLDEFGEEMLSKYCPNCGARMKGADDERDS